MANQDTQQRVPVKVYRSGERLTVAAPMPGMEPGDIQAEVTGDGRLLLKGQLRGELKGMKDVLVDEWAAGDYYREVQLPVAVDATTANVTYGNGVVVVVMPVSDKTKPATLRLDTLSATHGQHLGNTGHPVQPA